jgi:hypothetical protein
MISHTTPFDPRYKKNQSAGHRSNVGYLYPTNHSELHLDPDPCTNKPIFEIDLVLLLAIRSSIWNLRPFHELLLRSGN